MKVGCLRNSFGVSVAIHALLVFAWVLVMGQQSMKAPKRMTWIEVEPMPAALQPKKKVETVSPRIVQTQSAQPSKEAAKDAFLGKQTQTVDRQTVSAKRAIEQGDERPKAQPRERTKPQEQTRQALKTLGLPILPTDRNFTKPQQKVWTLDTPNWAQGKGLPQDYVKGLKEGESTSLNTKEYVFYGYFQRIRQRLDLAWSRSLREHLVKFYRRGRQLASDMDHTTRIMVTLNTQGEITRVQVMEASGTNDLDDAAVKAFNKAGPFPNPPKGIVDQATNSILIRWDFVLKT